MKWSGCQRWWGVTKDWKSLVKTAEQLCRRTTVKDEDTKKSSLPSVEIEDVQQNAEEERKKNNMKEREKQRIWDSVWRNQMRIQMLGDSKLIVNRMNRKWKIDCRS